MGTIIIKSRSERQAKVKEIVVFFICMACMFLFFSSAYTKVLEHERFVQGLARVSFLSGFAPLVAWLVPASEIAVALLLIVPKTQRYGLYGFASLMALFTLYIGGMMLWADKLPCGCNLFIEQLGWGQHLLFNTGFILLAIYALWSGKKI